MILMGNDALNTMPDCAATGKSASACGDELYSSMVGHMGTIVDAVHKVLCVVLCCVHACAKNRGVCGADEADVDVRIPDSGLQSVGRAWSVRRSGVNQSVLQSLGPCTAAGHFRGIDSCCLAPITI